MDKYVFDKSDEVGSGGYGTVYAGTVKETGKRVAIKRIKCQKFEDGVHITTLKEIKLLQEITHKNVIKLIDVGVNL